MSDGAAAALGKCQHTTTVRLGDLARAQHLAGGRPYSRCRIWRLRDCGAVAIQRRCRRGLDKTVFAESPVSGRMDPPLAARSPKGIDGLVQAPLGAKAQMASRCPPPWRGASCCATSRGSTRPRIIRCMGSKVGYALGANRRVSSGAARPEDRRGESPAGFGLAQLRRRGSLNPQQKHTQHPASPHQTAPVAPMPRSVRLATAASLLRPSTAETTNLPERRRRIAHHVVQNVTPGDPGESPELPKSCPTVAEKLPPEPSFGHRSTTLGRFGPTIG